MQGDTNQKSGLMEKFLLRVAKRWIAGATKEDAVCYAKDAYSKGMDAIVNRLGEHTHSYGQINKTVNEYVELVSVLRKKGISGGISVKPTQVGLLKSKSLCIRNLEFIISKSMKSQAFVWIDMEASEYTDDIIDCYLGVFEKYERTGIAIQANLKRSAADLIKLVSAGAKIRLVKGAYKENSKVAYMSRQKVDNNFRKLMDLLFTKANEFGIATHDSFFVNRAINLAKLNEKDFEFQMLKGVRDEMKLDLVSRGFKVSEYIPYGTNWFAYSIRRLKERKRNILLLGSSFFHFEK